MNPKSGAGRCVPVSKSKSKKTTKPQRSPRKNGATLEGALVKVAGKSPEELVAAIAKLFHQLSGREVTPAELVDLRRMALRDWPAGDAAGR